MIPAGKSLLMPKPAAKLLAKHLARQVYIKKAPVYGPSEVDGKGSDRPLWTEENCMKLADSFLSEEYEEEKKLPKTEAEIVKQKIEESNELLPETTSTETTPGSYMDKAQVIAELQKREIKFDARMNKTALERLLTEPKAE